MTAVHEGSHATIAVILGIPLNYATIDPRQAGAGHEGFTSTARLPEGAGVGTIIDRVLMLLGGAMGEGLAFGNKRAAEGSRTDAALALEALSKVGPVSSLAPLCAESGRLVCKHWPAIRAVAERLLESGTLSGNEVRELVARKGGDVMPLRLDTPCEDHRLDLGTGRADDDRPPIEILARDVGAVLGPETDPATLRRHVGCLCGQGSAFRREYLRLLKQDAERQRAAQAERQGEERGDGAGPCDSKAAALAPKRWAERAWREPLSAHRTDAVAEEPPVPATTARAAFEASRKRSEGEWQRPLAAMRP